MPMLFANAEDMFSHVKAYICNGISVLSLYYGGILVPYTFLDHIVSMFNFAR